MAALGQNSQIAEKNGSPQAPAKEFTELQLHCARLYGVGLKRLEIAKALARHMVPNSKDPRYQLRIARQRLKNWEQDQAFRDLVYHHAVVEIDMDTPSILKAISAKAQRGRVDAARLALELTGRHNPRGETGVAQVVVAINGIQRPSIGVGGDVMEVTATEVLDGEA